MWTAQDAADVPDPDLRADGVPRAVHHDGLLRPALRQVLAHPTTHVLPPLAAHVVGALGVLGVVVAAAYAVPTVLLDDVFHRVGSSPVVPVLAGLVALVALWCAVGASGVVVLAATARELGRVPHLGDLRREVARRRWSLLASTLLAALVVVVPIGGLGWLLVDGIGLPVWTAAVAAVVWTTVVAPLGALPAVALMADVGLVTAWRRTRALRDTPDLAARHSDDVRRVLGVGAAVVAAAWVAVPHVTGLPRVGVLVACGTLVMGVVAAGVARAVLRTTGLVAGVARDTSPAPARLALPASDGVAPRREVRRAWATSAVVVALVTVAPSVLVAANPTPALEPRVDAVGELGPEPFLVGLDDGVLVVDQGRWPATHTWCADDAACAAPTYPDVQLRSWEQAAVVPDPAGGVVVVARAYLGEEDVLVTASCDADVCERTTPDDAVVLGPSLGLPQVAAADGTYAFVLATDRAETELAYAYELTLVRCSTAACTDRADVVVATAGSGYQTAVEVAPDGTVVVLVADPNGRQPDGSTGSVRLWTVAPGTTEAVELVRLDAAPGRRLFPPVAGLPAFRLALHDDGAPVVLRTDPERDALWLTSCSGPACEEQVTSDLAVGPGTMRGVDLALDPSGRPLLATADREAGVTLRACVDQACSATRDGLVWPGSVPRQLRARYDPRFLELDGQGRPALLVAGPESDYVLRCAEVRCGL